LNSSGIQQPDVSGSSGRCVTCQEWSATAKMSLLQSTKVACEPQKASMLIWKILLDKHGINYRQKQKQVSVWDSSPSHCSVLSALTSMGEACQMFCSWSRRWHFTLRAISKEAKMSVFFFFQ